MGEHNVELQSAPEELRSFIRRLLIDLRALDKMIAPGLIESGIRRVGAEQELFLVNAAWRPAPVAQQVLALIADPKSIGSWLYGEPVTTITTQRDHDHSFNCHNPTIVGSRYQTVTAWQW